MKRPRGTSGRIEVEAFRRDMTADVHLLVAAARAVLVGFRQEVDGGALRPPQHASLLILEAAIGPFAGVPEHPASDETGGASPGPTGQRSGPATAADRRVA